MGARQHRYDGGSHYLILGVAFLATIGALGGASRADELQQFLVRGAAILAIVAALWPLDFSAFRDLRRAATGLLLVYVLLLVQLVPLPPDVWAQMPGHDVYAGIAQQTDTNRWRPWTISPDLTLNAVAALLPATAMGLLALAIDFRGRLVLARVIVAIACASASLGLMQSAAGGDTLHLFRTTSDDSAVGLFANRNHQAVFLACALPIGAALASITTQRTGFSRRSLALQLSIAALLLMGLGATGSRMGLLLGVVGVAAACAIYVTAAPVAEVTVLVSRWFSLAAAAGVSALLIAVALLVWRGGALERLASEPVDQTRIAALKPMLAAARAFFPFGAGFGTFDPVYRRFEPDPLLSTIYLNEAHNEPVQLAIEGGFAAMLLLLFFLIWWTRAAIRSVRPREALSRRALGMAMAATTLILMLSSLVDYPLRTPLLSCFFALACVEMLKSGRSRTPPLLA